MFRKIEKGFQNRSWLEKTIIDDHGGVKGLGGSVPASTTFFLPSVVRMGGWIVEIGKNRPDLPSAA
jgi:hypothetical protein